MRSRSLGLFPAPFFQVSHEPGVSRASSQVPTLRVAVWSMGVVLWVLVLLPPFATWSRRYEFFQAIQYSMFAFVIPLLLTSGAQWRRVGLTSGSSHDIDADGVPVTSTVPRLVDRVAMARVRTSRQQQAVVVAIVFIALSIFWRIAPIVDTLTRHAWLEVVESITLVLCGTALFSHLVESPPMSPSASRPYRISISAAVMWSAWVVAYLGAMSNNSWYRAFHHVAGSGISLAADQQFSAGIVWLLSAGVFVPIIFWNLIQWLQSEEDPDHALGRLLREERSRGFFGTN